MSSQTAPSMRSLPATLWQAIDDARGQEVCGLLVQHEDQLRFRRLENLAGRYGEFWIDADELERVTLDIARQNGEVKALLHSHTHSAAPSAADRALATRTPWPLLIVTAAHEIVTAEPAGNP
jgi:proteasome lid subunit RPN8/RPN11